MKDQINTIREALEPFAKDAAGIHTDWADERRRTSLTGADKITVGDMRRAAKALTALAQLEAMAGAQEPVAWRHSLTLDLFDTQEEVPLADGDEWAEPLFLYAAPVAQQPLPCDSPCGNVKCAVGCKNHVAQQPQARPDFSDEWTGYLKDGETPFERFLRERKDLDALTKLYQRALEENERLKAQQPQAEALSDDLRDRLVAIGQAIADQDDRAAQAMIREILAAPQQAEAMPSSDLNPDEGDPVTLWAEIWRLREAVKGPDGYATWQDAATAERIRRVRAESKQAEEAKAVPPHDDTDLIEQMLEALRSCSGVPHWPALIPTINAARKRLETPQQAEAVPPDVVRDADVEAAAKKMAEIFDYPWDFMPEKGRNTMRENVRAVLGAAMKQGGGV